MMSELPPVIKKGSLSIGWFEGIKLIKYDKWQHVKYSQYTTVNRWYLQGISGFQVYTCHSLKLVEQDFFNFLFTGEGKKEVTSLFHPASNTQTSHRS